MSRGNSDARRRRAQQISRNGAVDLATKGLSNEQAWKLQAELEMALGMRCAGCGRRVTFGTQFASLDVSEPQRPVMYRASCSRGDCDFMEQCREGATAMKMIEFAWLDEMGAEGPSFGLGLTPHVPAPDA